MTGGLWYDRVYLCWENTNFDKPKTSTPITGFTCYKYKSIVQADTIWNYTLSKYKDMEVRHTVIPVCKWVPEVFDKYIINRKLRQKYWLEKNTFGNGNSHCHDIHK